MVDTANSIKNRVQDAGNQVGQVAEKTSESARSIAGEATNRAKQWVDDATKGAQNIGTYISERAEEATSAVGSRLRAASEGVSGASAAMAHTLESTGEYFKKESLTEMMDDVVVLVKRNPIASLLMGVGVGYLAARGLRHRE